MNRMSAHVKHRFPTVYHFLPAPGRIVGTLRVLSQSTSKRGKAVRSWHCQCICGLRVCRSQSELMDYRRQSCGCIEKHLKIEVGETYYDLMLKYQLTVESVAGVMLIQDRRYKTLYRVRCGHGAIRHLTPAQLMSIRYAEVCPCEFYPANGPGFLTPMEGYWITRPLERFRYARPRNEAALSKPNPSEIWCQGHNYPGLRRPSKDKDITHHFFGAYRVVGIERKGVWRCLCQCGREKNVLRQTLMKGKSRSCGCVRWRRDWNYGSAYRGGMLVFPRPDVSPERRRELEANREYAIYIERSESRSGRTLAWCECGKSLSLDSEGVLARMSAPGCVCEHYQDPRLEAQYAEAMERARTEWAWLERHRRFRRRRVPVPGDEEYPRFRNFEEFVRTMSEAYDDSRESKEKIIHTFRPGKKLVKWGGRPNGELMFDDHVVYNRRSWGPETCMMAYSDVRNVGTFVPLETMYRCVKEWPETEEKLCVWGDEPTVVPYVPASQNRPKKSNKKRMTLSEIRAVIKKIREERGHPQYKKKKF